MTKPAAVPLRVVVADDHAMVREGLRAVLGAHPGAELVATAANGAEAVAAVAEQRPDVVVMDLGMPEMDGIEATRRILALDPDVAVLVLTMYEQDERVAAALDAGARGYLLKGASHVDVVGAIAAVAAGSAVFGAGVAGTVLGRLRGPGTQRTLLTVLFTDIVTSTHHLAELGNRAWRELLDHHDEILTAAIERQGGRLIKSTGDGGLAVFGSAGGALACARDAVMNMRPLGVDIRAGIHAGECELRENDVGGLAVHVAARVVTLADANEVLVTATVADLVAGTNFLFTSRGEHDLAGIPGRWRLFTLRAV